MFRAPKEVGSFKYWYIMCPFILAAGKSQSEYELKASCVMNLAWNEHDAMYHVWRLNVSRCTTPTMPSQRSITSSILFVPKKLKE